MIPNVASKRELKYEWFDEYPVYTVRKTIIKVSERIGNTRKTAKWIYKRVIIEIIKELGLPTKFSSEEWNDYLDDPIIDQTSFDDSDNVNEIDINI